VAAVRSIEIRTEIPGPRSRAILDRHERAVAAPLSISLPVVVAEGRGALVTDLDGNTFVDFTGGVGALNVGHAHPRVVQAAQEQLARFLHTDYTVMPYPTYVELAERLGSLVPISGPVKTGFFNSGAEAVENAVKVARLATGRPAVVAFEGGFHGRTLMALTLTSKTHPYKAGIGPFAPEVYRAPFPSAYRGPDADGALAALERLFVSHVAAEHVAAIVFEPQQGEGGFVPADPAFVRGLRRVCDQHGIVLVADEVQTGFGRTGRMFAMEHFDVEPDLVVLAKSIAAGLPLSALVGRSALMDAPPDSSLGGTYVGNPVAQAAALAVLDVLEEERLVERADLVGERLRERMHGWQLRHPEIGDVRGLGAMVAIELVSDPGTKEPAPALARAVVDEAARRGLLLLRAGLHDNCIRVLCPLVITDAELEEALDAWEGALGAALG
jgi:4-aminobutyrate aminotransferase/(S)-3-amino-2-methylpropionate transaminase